MAFGAGTSQDFNLILQLWVHCAANMRLSAFMYRYRVCVLGVDKRVARSDLNKIWEPFGVWKKFVESEKSF